MSEAFQPSLDFEGANAAAQAGEALIVDVDGFEGPLHLLLALARRQKVDLLRISIADLAAQYLAFVNAARQRRFGLAAEYLVMAAWLTFLKSRLLLPIRDGAAGENSPAEPLAGVLALKLAKLEAMRSAARALEARPITGRDVFMRPNDEPTGPLPDVRGGGDLFPLLQAYVAQRRRRGDRAYQAIARIEAYPLEAARERLRMMAAGLIDWTPLDQLAPQADGAAPPKASYLASSFAAALELVKDRVLEARQSEAFAPVYLRAPPVCSELAG